jgi:hypothetical protein
MWAKQAGQPETASGRTAGLWLEAVLWQARACVGAILNVIPRTDSGTFDEASNQSYCCNDVLSCPNNII